eukprot:707904-Pyramimonas_sp.AAC.1
MNVTVTRDHAVGLLVRRRRSGSAWRRSTRACGRRRSATGIFSLPSRDWCPPRVYSLSPRAIGARFGYILSALTQSVPAT